MKTIPINSGELGKEIAIIVAGLAKKMPYFAKLDDVITAAVVIVSLSEIARKGSATPEKGEIELSKTESMSFLLYVQKTPSNEAQKVLNEYQTIKLKFTK